jgi:hypothetical protein
VVLGVPPALLAWSEGAGEEAATAARLRFREGAAVVVVGIEAPFRWTEEGIPKFNRDSGGGGEDPSARIKYIEDVASSKKANSPLIYEGT